MVTTGQVHVAGEVDTTGYVAIPRIVRDRPAAIIEDLDLLRRIYAVTAAYGHFGRVSADGVENGFTWERTDRIEPLRAAVSG